MIELENVEIMGWEHAIRGLQAKGYRRTKNGRYEAFCSDHCDTIYLGTHDTVSEAENAVLEYRFSRFASRMEEYGLNPDDGIVFEDHYVAYPNGMIFNLNGERIIGGINRDGYVNGIINGRNVQFHRIIASIFCEREIGKNFVNHIDGNKLNNDASNLEWVTRSDNTLHSFNMGLQNNIAGVPIYTYEEKKYIKKHCFDYYKDVAKHLDRNPETVRKYMYKYRKEFVHD